MSRVGAAMQIEKKGVIDLVTETDREIQRTFRALVTRRFPGHVVLGEEFSAASERDETPPFCWLFDPIDGTTNFAHGLPIFCSSLALEIDGEIVVGAVYDPTRRELFTAERGQGAWLNGAPLVVSTTDALIDSLLVTGFHYGIQRDPEELVSLFRDFIRTSRAVRRLGSAALDMCYVAAGRFDGYWESKIQPWDVAAGALIVTEAGGRVSTIGGDPFRSRAGSVIASNGRIHDLMLDVILGFNDARRAPNRTL